LELNSRTAAGFCWLPIFTAAGLLLGCAGLTTYVPQITPAVTAAGAESGASPATLAAGREIMMTKCVTCHAIQPIEAHSSMEWTKILSMMEKRSGLDSHEAEQLRAYVLACRKAADSSSGRR
jgi:uncharacterized membrane protein